MPGPGGRVGIDPERQCSSTEYRRVRCLSTRNVR